MPAYDVAGLRPHVVVDGKADGLMDFIGRFHYLTAILTDLDACRRVAYENVEDAQREGIDYIELRFSPWFMAEPNGLAPEGVVAGVVDEVIDGERDFGVRAQIIGIMSRTYDTETCHHELDALLAHRDHLVAVDLAVEPRLKVGVLNQAGLDTARQEDIKIVHYLPRVRQPVLQFSGRYDTLFRYEDIARPFFERLGSEQKKHVVEPTGHFCPYPVVVGETLAWLDQHL